jgi:hypothetical protein
LLLNIFNFVMQPFGQVSSSLYLENKPLRTLTI